MNNLHEKVLSITTSLWKSTEGLSDMQLNFKPSANEWSILQCLEHIFLINRTVLKTLPIIITNENSSNNKTELFGEGKLHHLLVNKRSFKVPAPEAFKPNGKFTQLQDSISSINQITDALVSFIDINPIEKYTQTFKHPFLGEMTATDWIYFVISHTQRHIHQIEEIRANSNFPS